MDQLCAVCLEDLSCPPRRDPDGSWRAPSTKLEVGGKTAAGGLRPWQISTFGPDPIVKKSPGFNGRSVWRIYHLCGDGHIWLADRLPNDNAGGRRARGGRQVVEENDLTRLRQTVTLAMVGEVAAGKSYLLARTLAQSLFVSSGWSLPGAKTAWAYEPSSPDGWEDKAGQDLSAAYDHTRMSEMPMAATELRTLLPARLLSAAGLSDGLEFGLDDDLVQVLLRIHRELPGGGGPSDPNFGQRIRQPVVLRATFTRRDDVKDERTTWTGVADLAGESFTEGYDERETQEARLRGFDGLVWVIDPAVNRTVSTAVREALADEPRYGLKAAERVLAASTRPDAPGGATMSRSSAVARSVAAARGMRRMYGPSQPIYVVISKCDLIRKALLVDGFKALGSQVTEGVCQFIRYVLTRSRSDRNVNDGVIVLSEALDAVLRSLHRVTDPGLMDRKVEAMAAGLLEHFGSPGRFWGLVHGQDRRGSDAMTVVIPGPDTFSSVRLEVPSLRQHMVDSLQPDRTADLQVRDFVMSALGCGIACGLGFSDPIDRLMEARECDLRFFLCSPLVNPPIQPLGTNAGRQIKAAEGGGFPDLNDPSAGLTHLLLAMMRVGLK